MKKFTIELSDQLYSKLEKKSLEETLRKEKFVGMGDIIIQIFEKEFKK